MKIDNKLKYCKPCDKWKLHKEFGKATARKDGMKSNCKACISTYNKKYKHENYGPWEGQNHNEL